MISQKQKGKKNMQLTSPDFKLQDLSPRDFVKRRLDEKKKKIVASSSVSN